MKSKQILTVVVLGLALLGVGLIAPASHAPAIAAPPAAPTSVTGLVESTQRNLFTPMTARRLTASTNTDAMEISSFGWADFEYTVDISDTQAITVTAQYSNDKTNWVNGPNIAANVTADGSDLTRLPLFGNYMRLAATLETTAPVTVTLSALAR